ncbi:MAG: hypothetical protein ITF99_02475 [Chryseobacterium sp.]|nr:hypothetical protein [Chryseobacterium sp.]
MKLNLNVFKYVFYFTFCFPISTVKGQQLVDKSVENHRDKIIEFLISKKELLGDSKSFQKMIYATNVGSTCEIYEIGTTSSHSIPFLMIIEDNAIKFLETKELQAEINSILNYMKKKNCSSEKVIDILSNVVAIYEQNIKMSNRNAIIYKCDIKN